MRLKVTARARARAVTRVERSGNGKRFYELPVSPKPELAGAHDGAGAGAGSGAGVAGAGFAAAGFLAGALRLGAAFFAERFAGFRAADFATFFFLRAGAAFFFVFVDFLFAFAFFAMIILPIQATTVKIVQAPT